MNEKLTRRDLLVGAAAAVTSLAVEARGAQIPNVTTPITAQTEVGGPANGTILPLTSTSGVFIPPRGRITHEGTIEIERTLVHRARIAGATLSQCHLRPRKVREST